MDLAQLLTSLDLLRRSSIATDAGSPSQPRPSSIISLDVERDKGKGRAVDSASEYDEDEDKATPGPSGGGYAFENESTPDDNGVREEISPDYDNSAEVIESWRPRKKVLSTAEASSSSGPSFSRVDKLPVSVENVKPMAAEDAKPRIDALPDVKPDVSDSTSAPRRHSSGSGVGQPIQRASRRCQARARRRKGRL